MKLTKIQQAIAGVLVIIVFALATHFLFLKQDYATIKKVEKSIADYKGKINVAKAIEQAATELQDEMIHLKAQLERLKKILPVAINEPKFLADIKRFANENGLEIRKLVHLKPVVRDTIVEHPFGIETRGNYHDFGNFYAQLTNYQRIVSVQGLSLARSKNVKEYTTETSFLISIFTYKEPSEEELLAKIEEKKAARNEAEKAKGKKSAKGKSE